MKRLQLSITILLLTTVLFISCTENEPVIEEVPCVGENYTIQIDRVLSKLTTTHPGNLPTIRNYEYSYNSYNLLAEINEYTFDYDLSRLYEYACNNNLSLITNNKSLKYDLEYDENSRIISYKTTNSFLHDYNLTYNDNKVTVSGMVNKQPNITLTLERNVEGLVTRLSREDGYSTFNYDTNGNLTKAKDYDNANTLLKEYQISYDSNPNPFYGQFKSNYLERFIDYFSESTFRGVDYFFRFDQYKFPYLKNNPTLLEDKKCTPCYKDLLKRTYEYDTENYPIKMEESHVGAPAVLYEYKYQ